MSANSKFSQFGFATRAVHAGNDEEFHNGFFRFSVGIEDVDDIIADLRQAMEQVGLL